MSRRNSLSAMDIDSPAGLKRSSSAPMINDIVTTMAQASTSMSSPRESTIFNLFDNSPRIRRLSGSFSPHPGIGPRLTPRVTQLRLEECLDNGVREVAHEKELHSAMQMSQSWEDLTIVTGSLSCSSETDASSNSNNSTFGIKSAPGTTDTANNKKLIQHRFNDPLQVTLPQAPLLCSSPSPTRTGIRHFSPSLSQWTMSPSPTRKAFQTRRSLSPIALRPSTFGMKRKIELEEDNQNHLSPPTKRLNSGGLLVAQRLSPLGSLSSVGTPESLSSVDSPGFFRPVDSPSPNQNAPSPHVDEPMPEEPRQTDKHDTPMTLVETNVSSSS